MILVWISLLFVVGNLHVLFTAGNKMTEIVYNMWLTRQIHWKTKPSVTIQRTVRHMTVDLGSDYCLASTAAAAWSAVETRCHPRRTTVCRPAPTPASGRPGCSTANHRRCASTESHCFYETASHWRLQQLGHVPHQ